MVAATPAMQPDLAIIGGGPAGLACAWKAARLGLRTVLFEPKQGNVEKPCGEGIMPGALDVLREMGVPKSATDCRPFPGIRYFVPGAEPLTINFPQAGNAYSRPVLDRLMRKQLQCEPGVSILAQKATVERVSGGFSVGTQDGTRWNPKWLVVADGAGGSTARWMRGPAKIFGPRLGLRARYQDLSHLDRVEIHLGQGVDFYLTPLPHGLLNVALMVDHPPSGVHGAESLFTWALKRHPQLLEKLGELTTPASSVPLQHIYPQRVTDGKVFLIGDAGGVADPILGTGLAVALRTGFQAAEAVALAKSGAPIKKVARTFRRQAQAERGPRQKLARLLHFASSHERVTRGVVAVLQRTPRIAQRLAATAAGVPLQSAKESQQ